MMRKNCFVISSCLYLIKANKQGLIYNLDLHALKRPLLIHLLICMEDIV